MFSVWSRSGCFASPNLNRAQQGRQVTPEEFKAGRHALGLSTSELGRVLGVDAGRIETGATADVCIFDPERYWKVGPDTLKSLGKNTPFTGIELKGRVRYTLVEGQVIYESA